MHSVGCHLSDIQEAVMEFYKETEKETGDTQMENYFFKLKTFYPSWESLTASRFVKAKKSFKLNNRFHTFISTFSPLASPLKMRVVSKMYHCFCKKRCKLSVKTKIK